MFHCFPVSGYRLELLYIMISIPICGEITGNELKLQPLNPTQHWSCWRPWDAQLQSGGSRSSVCLDLPRDLFLKRLSCFNLLGIRQSRGPRRSSCLDLPRDPILRRPTCLYLRRDPISRRLSCLSLPGDLHPDPGMSSSRVATVLGKISFGKTSLRESTHGNRRKPISCGTVPSLSNNSGAQ